MEITAIAMLILFFFGVTQFKKKKPTIAESPRYIKGLYSWIDTETNIQYPIEEEK